MGLVLGLADLATWIDYFWHANGWFDFWSACRNKIRGRLMNTHKEEKLAGLKELLAAKNAFFENIDTQIGFLKDARFSMMESRDETFDQIAQLRIETGRIGK